MESLNHLVCNEVSTFAEGEVKSSKYALNPSAGPHAASNAQAALRVSEPEGQKTDRQSGYI